MKFKLVEDAPRLNKNLTQEFNQADDKRRKEIIWEVISKYNNPSLKNLFHSVYQSAIHTGLDPQTNDYLNLIGELKFKPLYYNHGKNFEQLALIWQKNDIDLSKDYLKRQDIYDVKEKDFYYVLNLFDIVNNPTKLSKYFKNIDDISESDLYDESGNLKPVGKSGDGLDTLFGTVESWSGEDGVNDADETNSSVKVTATQLENAQKRPYQLLSDVPKSEDREGNVIFVKWIKYESGRINFEDYVNDFFIFRGGKWSRLN